LKRWIDELFSSPGLFAYSTLRPPRNFDPEKQTKEQHDSIVMALKLLDDLKKKPDRIQL